jgi:hypothetical protein
MMIGLALAGFAVASAAPSRRPAPATAPVAAPAGPLENLRQGQWELRMRGSAEVQRLCIGGWLGLIQLRHPGRSCERIVLEQSSQSLTVQYTCRGNGFGRTHLRRETAQLVQVDTQGIADGLPFDYSAEGRWVGECPRPRP